MPSDREPKAHPNSLPAISADAALSFLKDTKGALSWTARDLANTLKISHTEAEQALALLEAQGYVQPVRGVGPVRSKGPARNRAGRKGAAAHGEQQWVTTPAGETVSGAKSP